MKKLLSILIVGLFTAVGSFASADTIEITSVDNAYVPAEITFSDWTTLQVGFINDITCNSSRCMLVVKNTNSDCALNYSSSPSFQGDCAFEPGTYVVTIGTKASLFSSVVLSSSTIVVPGNTENGGSENDSLLNPGVISSGVQNGVSAFTNGLGNLIPTLLIIGLPVLIIMLFRKYIRSYIKHIFVVDKPRGDDMANCDLYVDNNGQLVHDYRVNGHEYVYIDDFGYVDKLDLPKYLDENLEFDSDGYYNDHRGKQFTYDKEHYDNYDWHYWNSPNGRVMRDSYIDGEVRTQYKDDYGYWRNAGETAGFDDLKDKHDENPLASYKYGL